MSASVSLSLLRALRKFIHQSIDVEDGIREGEHMIVLLSSPGTLHAAKKFNGNETEPLKALSPRPSEATGPVPKYHVGRYILG